MVVKLRFYQIRLIIGLERDSVLFLGEAGPKLSSGAALCAHVLTHWTVQLSCEQPWCCPLYKDCKVTQPIRDQAMLPEPRPEPSVSPSSFEKSGTS